MDVPQWDDLRPAPWDRVGITRLVAGIAVAGAALWVLRPFITSLAWAALAAFATWPVYAALRRATRSRTASAMVASMILTLVLGGTVALVATLMAREGAEFYKRVATDGRLWLESIQQLAIGLPWVGERLGRLFETDGLAESMNAYGDTLAAIAGSWAKMFARELSRYALEFVVFLMALFFMYRDGERWMQTLRRLGRALLGPGAAQFERPISDTVQAIGRGWLLTSFAQGLVAGLGYWVAGAPAPITFTILTTIAALIPFGATVIWLLVCGLLVAEGAPGAALGLAIWSIVVVSTIDNVLRPWIVTNTVKLHFLTVFLGMLGGLAAFGLIGLFLGPVVLVSLGLIITALGPTEERKVTGPKTS